MMIFGKKLNLGVSLRNLGVSLRLIVGVVLMLAALSLSCSKESALGPKPSLDTPAINAMTNKQCVKPAAYMRSNHMTMLNDWRDTVVRGGDRNLGEIDGVIYEKSLQHTCLKCHSNPTEFCDKCHSYASVKVYCWDCHVKPKSEDVNSPKSEDVQSPKSEDVQSPKSEDVKSSNESSDFKSIKQDGQKVEDTKGGEK
jgi:hypothetical protein